MRVMRQGMGFVLVGIVLLLILLFVNVPFSLWVIVLIGSVTCNMMGVTKLVKYIHHTNKQA
ncbi:hypothetical protein [Metabacillus iocasae]|uniref:Uncharacterized protein YqfA (UPF0365 family) n=1 Tax=Priestia iocasae TaxID=2291674 RepID=A0ABS2QX63_9BACI|nr:hypothetical protein [Metabacillus iocasae]MBM7703069.1 uncharacterized protein YqfA (UPF0365 family) [Metabacillus iocasae]